MIIKSEIKRESFVTPLNTEKRANTLSAMWREVIDGKLVIIDEDYQTMVRTIKFVPCDPQGHELKNRYWCDICGNIYAQYPQVPTPESPFPCSVPCGREQVDGGTAEVIWLNDQVISAVKCCGRITHHMEGEEW